MAKQTIQCFKVEDAGHAWLVVANKDVADVNKETGVAGSISGYSYIDLAFSYLEEDLDAKSFLLAAGESGHAIEVGEPLYVNSNAGCRKLPTFSPGRLEMSQRLGGGGTPVYDTRLALPNGTFGYVKSPLIFSVDASRACMEENAGVARIATQAPAVLVFPNRFTEEVDAKDFLERIVPQIAIEQEVARQNALADIKLSSAGYERVRETLNEVMRNVPCEGVHARFQEPIARMREVTPSLGITPGDPNRAQAVSDNLVLAAMSSRHWRHGKPPLYANGLESLLRQACITNGRVLLPESVMRVPPRYGISPDVLFATKNPDGQFSAGRRNDYSTEMIGKSSTKEGILSAVFRFAADRIFALPPEQVDELLRHETPEFIAALDAAALSLSTETYTPAHDFGESEELGMAI